MKIFQNNPEYSYVENEIINAINHEPLIFLTHSLIEYSKKINCSKSAISRLVKLLKFTNLNQMKLFVQEQLILNNFYYDINQNETMSLRINNIKSYNNFAINKTIESIDLNNLKVIIDKITQSKTIHLFGVGSSYLAAYELANNLLKINFNVSCSQDIHNSILTIANFQEQDFLILFSKSGTTKEINFLIEQMRIKNSNILLITANAKLKTKNNFFVIHHKEIDKDYRIIATSSKISQLIISDIIFYEIFFQSKQNMNLIENTFIELKKWKKYK